MSDSIHVRIPRRRRYAHHRQKVGYLHWSGGNFVPWSNLSAEENDVKEEKGQEGDIGGGIVQLLGKF